MPIRYDTDVNKWVLDLSEEEVIYLPLLLKYLQDKINTKSIYVKKDHKMNTLLDLRLVKDEGFFNA